MIAATMDAHVMNYVRSHEQAVVRSSRRAGVLAQVGRVVRGIKAGFVLSFIAGRIDSHGSWLSDQSLWFVGAAKAIDSQDRSTPLDPDFAVVDRLRSMEARLIKEQRRAMVDLDIFPPVVQKALKHYQESLGAMLEAVRDLRGAIQAYEADRGAGLPVDVEQQTAEALERILQGRTTAA